MNANYGSGIAADKIDCGDSIIIEVYMPPYKFSPNHPIFGSTFPLSSLHFTKPLLSKGFVFPIVLYSRTFISLLSKTQMSVLQSYDCHNSDNKIIENINKVGWSVVMIEATEYLPSFAYTIGLWKNYNQPEIISFGLSVKTLHSVLNIAGENIKNGKQYLMGTQYSDFFAEGNSQLISVDPRNIRDYFGYAIWFNNGVEFPALQLVWTDRNNKFPWHDDYEEEFIYRQPLLDRNADFKFREVKNLAVFTTRQWLEQNNPILHVVHDEEGDWQFLTGDQMPEDAKIVALEQMVLRDNSLNDIFNLDYGEQAERDSINGEWKRSKSVLEE